ncbi:enoyl-CoA hydratase/isomerase family protein [Flavobacterium agrisoli]|uniref:Enoyl-CoA hydratase/isomerase family protein n=1 Tax=Flavobacterium agrisoli TaxID=2793066 RepID=A0A934UKY2_9FLAO|nr:enoyl-CoA hydratase/isomerase family protein [Flavobacterium agrisoli]MBK0371043.1 enoyl-CoA hydratase/isomerase family protein [Flavobacterium agrisoli]
MSTASTSGSIQTAIHNSIATVTFYHPLGNSFPAALLQKLASEFDDLSQNAAVKVIVLQSKGATVFCAGASFDELLAVKNEEEGKVFFSGFAHLILAMISCSKIIIGRVQAKAVGGGVGIIAACDYVVAASESSLKLSELSIGIGPFVIEPVVSYKIGKTNFAKMCLEAKQWHTADWAQQNGLFSKVVAKEQVDDAVLQLANELASFNPEALFEIKKIIWNETHHWKELLFERAKISGQLVLSDFTKNALLAFKK